MPEPIRFVLALHNHQPVGNFDHVFEQAYQDSYRLFLDVLAGYPSLKIALHTSGSLMEWLDAHHPDYVDRLAEMVGAGQIEVLGGAFFEPILAMIPTRDRIGQIRSYTRWLEDRLGATIRGMWIPERVWEQSYTRDLVAAGIEYTILDDFHFKNAGLGDEELFGHYLTEDDGRVMSIFPGSERLRYLVPFGQVHETIEYLAGIAEQRPGTVVVFGDDGEKFGTWPQTRKHCYDDGWLKRFFDALMENQAWLHTTTLSEAFTHVLPEGKIYLPESSYREMTEWALPAERQLDYDRVTHEMHDDPRWPLLARFIRGGYWRNFRVKYSESNEMYARMMSVSRRLQQAIESGAAGELVDEARRELYRAQCNCGYWHGAFGGVYLPHLRHAVFGHLIAADNLLDRVADRPDAWVEAKADDLNFDTRQEIQLANDKLVALVAPAGGGHLYELDVRAIRHNLLATMTRRLEVYHRKVVAGAGQNGDSCSSIHDRVVFKQDGLDQRVQYDGYPRKSLVDLFYEPGATLEAVAAGQAAVHGDFVRGDYEARLRRNPERIQILLTREGNALGIPLKITKGLTLAAGSSALEIAYRLEGLPQDAQLSFAVEMNFAGLPAGADDRYFHDLRRNRLGQLGTRLELADADGFGLADEWLGIDLRLKASRPTHFWAFPVESVSQSEGGFELVHQSVAVQPHWLVTPDADGRWTVVMRLEISAGKEENHADNSVAAAAAT